MREAEMERLSYQKILLNIRKMIHRRNYECSS
jgi:hypothetical protein